MSSHQTSIEPGSGRILYDAETIQEAVSKLSITINRSIPEPDVLVVIVLNGGMFFASDLLRGLPMSWETETLRVSSYGNDIYSRGKLTWLSPVPNVKDRVVLLVDDICDTGLTLQDVKAALLREGATKVYTCTAFTRQGALKEPDFTALRPPKGFLTGYGLDRVSTGRGLPYVLISDK